MFYNLLLSGSEASDLQGYEINFETLSQTIISRNHDKLKQYLESKSQANRKAVSSLVITMI